MYRIGIIGSENSHAMAYAKLINLPNAKTGRLEYPDFKVVGIGGLDEEASRRVFDEADLEFIAQSNDDFLGKVDTMMITTRHGKYHAPYAAPFIEAGLPVFVDKPFTICADEARSLCALAKAHGAPIMGGSSVKNGYDVLTAYHFIEQAKRRGRIIGASLNFPADTNSVYGGIYFYGPHLVETCLTIFGPGMKSIVAVANKNIVSAIARYPDFDVSLQFTEGAPDHAFLFITSEGNHYREMVSAGDYGLQLDQFVQMVRTGVSPVDHDALIRPIAVLNAIEQSLETGREVPIPD